MLVISKCVLLFLSFLHFYFLALEMFFWTKPLGLKTFRMTLDQAKDRSALAANQGLYNGFLAMGLLWAVLHPDPAIGNQLAIFFCLCVFLAGAYGGYSVHRKIFFIQGMPGLVGLLLALTAVFRL